VFIHSIGEVWNNNNFHATFHATLSRILYAKFDGNLLTTFKVIVKKTFGLLFVDTVYITKIKMVSAKDGNRTEVEPN